MVAWGFGDHDKWRKVLRLEPMQFLDTLCMSI